MSAEYFARSGIVWVGVSVSPVSIDFLREGCSFLSQPPCGTRYASLSLDELYPSKLGYVLRVLFETFELRRERFLLRENAREILWRALQADVGTTPPPR